MENIINILKGSYSLIIYILSAVSLWYLIFEVDFKIVIFIFGMSFFYFSKSIFTEIASINNRLTKLETNSELTSEDVDYFYDKNERKSFTEDVQRKAERSLLLNIWSQNERTQDMIADILEANKKPKKVLSKKIK
jgi:ABC-type multidrug transport system fused ATPase/permease subunit